MATKVTQCPKCNTSFRITEAQLTVANGAVRCGSCLHIFNASDYWLEATVKSTPLTPEIDTELAQLHLDGDSKDDSQESLDDIFDDDIFADDFDLDDLNQDLLNSANQSDDPLLDELLGIDRHLTSEDNASEQLSLEALELENQTSFGAELPTDNDRIIEDNSDLNLHPDHQLIDDDESTSIINDPNDIFTSEELATELGTINHMEFDSDFERIDSADDNITPPFGDDDNDPQDSEHEKEWTQKLLEEDHDEIIDEAEAEPDSFPDILEPEQSQTELDSINDEPLIDESLIDESLIDEPLIEEPAETEQPSTEETAAEEVFHLGQETLVAGERIGSHNNTLLAHLEPEPVQMPRLNRRSQWIQRGWTVCIILALGLLATQYIVFNFDRLSRDIIYRPTLIKACTILNCKVPSLDDVKLIRSSHLVVRSHPKIEQALVIDTIMTNRATFMQRYPIMELQFTDLNGRVIADRRFYPHEYLAGELAGKQMMPIKQPIHISLAIVDPGSQAVNYQLQFHPQRDN